VKLERNTIILGADPVEKKEIDLNGFENIFMVGGGKATAPMAKAMETMLGPRITGGVINVKYGFTEDLVKTEIIEADHPLPDENGVYGTKKILKLLKEADEKTLIFSLISGGGSALLPQPAGGISLAEKQEITKKLLECGATIDEINTIRKHISESKGGQMARSAFPATTVNLMLSDVVGDRMDVIASGPFVPDQSTFQDAVEIIQKYQLSDIPLSIKNHLKLGIDQTIPDTPKPGDSIFHSLYNYIIGSNILALEACKEEAKKMGYTAMILSSMMEGESRELARTHTAIAQEILKTGQPIVPPACIISGGETTVTIRGDGLGGRNQEFCLAAALDMNRFDHRVVILSGGTDGNDGPTPAAGAIVDPLTIKRGEAAGLKGMDYLTNNDSYHFLEGTGDLLLTGPTNTNVMDVRIILVGARTGNVQ
jgi:hydroxypyruvate reductase